jgi:biotin synthase-related radical SAM superfamily protein
MYALNHETRLPPRIRVSMGSAVVLGLLDTKLDAAPRTVYLMTYRRGKCNANCGFCPQARESEGRADMLSRVTWPLFQTETVIDRIEEASNDNKVMRVCIQALNYPEVIVHLLAVVNLIHSRMNIPISVSCQPLGKNSIIQLFEAGAERIGIPLDAVTEKIFKRTKGVVARGPYDWQRQWSLLKEAVDVFGKGKVSTHLIVGLGETEEQMIRTIQKCVDKSVVPGLFAFTPIRGTALERESTPPLEEYRRIQLARYLIFQGMVRFEEMSFGSEGNLTGFGVSNEVLRDSVEKGEAFLTCGCPDCNRPYYNEKPSGPIFNYPRRIVRHEISEIKKQFKLM